MVNYEFHGGNGEVLDWINIPQRHHYQVKGAPYNSIGLFQDNDTYGEILSNYASILGEKRNPLNQEFWSTVIGVTTASTFSPRYRDVRFDNFHQTNYPKVQEPTALGPGCPECLHEHWRWGAVVPNAPAWGSGFPLVPPLSRQTVDIGVVRYPGKVGPQQQWISLVNGYPLRKLVSQMCPVCIKPILVERGVDPVFWFSPTGYTSSDTFFYHTAWFNPHPPGATSSAVNIESAAAPSPMSPLQDGPLSVVFGDVYQDGTTTFGPQDLSTFPPLPAGYAALGNTGYSVQTTALVSGPHVINFSAASVTDQSAFNNLRIFHLEPDQFDPDRVLWVDTTIFSPDTPESDFSSKTISAQAFDLGVFVIGNLVQSVAPSNDVSDIVVTGSASPNPITAGNQLTYAIQVTNNGPQTAHEVALRNGLSPDVNLISATSAHGGCKENDGTVFCSLNSLNVGETATIAIVVTPTERTGSFPTEGKNIYNTALAKANELDTNIDNNSASVTTLVMPNPNRAPSVSITSPQMGTPFVGPTSITINATASDSDGTISKVEFFDNGQLIGQGTPTGNNQYVITKQNASFGEHSLIAVATDNGGRQNISDVANVIVNGAASVTITAPSAGALLAPGSSMTVSANASHPSGIINKVEFFANGESIGLGSLVNGSQYSVGWNNLNDGIYALVAVATDGSGITTTSAPVTVTVDTPPTVTMTSPVDGSVFPSLTNISVSAVAESAHASIARVDFYANGILVGSASDVGTNRFTATWRHLADSYYSLTAVATDNLGVSTTSAAITIGVNTSSPRAGEFIWFDDDVPLGATKHADGDVDWYWVDANPGAFSGMKAHQSRNFGQLDTPNGVHQHSFDGATTTLPVGTGDKLFTYVFLDINNMPREIMLQWKDANGWEHRAYWGQNTINSGTDGTSSRYYMGPLPKASTWVRLEVPASAVGLEGSTLNGMAFTLDAGRATWDLAGKATSNATPPPTSPAGDSVWIEDGLPAGAVTATVNDQWNWVSNPLYSGQLAHQSQVSVNHNTIVYRSHSFTGAQTPMEVNPGDVLFTYVYLDPTAKPDQIMLQWYDGTGWEHRAFWGEDFIGQQFRTLGVQGTESQRYMGGLPPAGSWYRLEVPASYVGLEGKSVSGMAFSLYGKEPTVAWDRSGKASALTTTPLLLSATTAVWRTFSNTYGYAFETNDLGPADHTQPKIVFYANPNQASGTVPFYRFRRPDSANHEYFYSQSTSYDGNGWILDGTAFYVYPDATTPGTLPLYLYHDSHFHYFLTTDQSEATGMALDGIAAYVTATNPLVPTAPTNLTWDQHAFLDWTDNSATETGFKIERYTYPAPDWIQVATVPANTTFFKPGSLNLGMSRFRVRATNSFGDSDYSNSKCTCFEVWQVTPNTPPDVSITSPGTGDVVATNFTIAANAFDVDGNGTITKVEFFANGNKLGEAGNAPFLFAWNNVTSGTYSLTVTATDGAGAVTTSSPISVMVDSAPTVSITSPTSAALFSAPATININASASDSDGTISKVEFFQGSIKIGEVAAAPYSLVWSNVAGGNYLLTAVATDNLGRATVSSPVSISVNAPPTVSITTPVGGSVFTAPTDLTINASAGDSDGTISKVEFYQGATLLGTDTTSPYSLTWTNVSAGSYSIAAKATDNLGAVTTSVPITIIVNALPNVSISSPASGTTFFAPANVGINAAASDDGSISKVEFFQGSVLIGTSTTSPYSLNWSNVPIGNYSLTAKATDNLGAARTSSSVNITVVQPSNSGKIAFASNRDGSAQIYSMNQDGSSLFRLTSDVANDERPRWSPNNLRLVFQSDRDNLFSGSAEIYLMNWDGSGQTRLTNNAYDDSAPVWSPDGNKIAFQSARNGVNYQVYVMNADGSGQVNVSNGTANDIQPSWSPDGTKIAFASDRDQAGLSSIYVMNANGSNQTRLTVSGTGLRDEQPAWSPDGTKLAFTSTRDSTVLTWQETDDDGAVLVRTAILSNKEVYVMNADGSNPMRLTNTLENDDSPTWSSDGTKIAFRSDRATDCCDPVEQIWKMNADGSNQLNLSNSGFGDYCPSWSH
jgi:uncharacterized repeat protein (TIGR01451 family)